MSSMDYSACFSEELLLTISHAGHSLKDYMEDFQEISHLVSWNDGTLKVCFWSGLDNPGEKHLAP